MITDTSPTADAHRAAATAKAHLPGRSPDAQNYGKEAGAKIDNAVSIAPFIRDHLQAVSTSSFPPTQRGISLTFLALQIAEADKQVGRAKSNIEAFGKDARAEALKAVDKFDAKVEEGAAKAKSGVSSWFGGGK